MASVWQEWPFPMRFSELCTPWLTRQELHFPPAISHTAWPMPCIFPYVISYNAKEPEAAARYAEIANAIGITGTVEECIEGLRKKSVP